MVKFSAVCLMCCNGSKQQYLEKNGIVWRWRIFAALSQEAPLDLMRLLLAEGAAGLPKGEIATRPSVPSSTLSLDLAALERAGLPPLEPSGPAARTLPANCRGSD